MRTEVKIGIVVGLIIVAGAVFFFVQQGRRADRNLTDVLPVDAPAERVTAPAPAPRVTPAAPDQRRPALPLAQRPGGVEAPRPLTTTPPAASPTVPSAARPAPTGPPSFTAARPLDAEESAATPATQPSPAADLPPLIAASPGAGESISEPPSPLTPPPTISRPESETVRTPTPGVALPPRGETPTATLIPPPPTMTTGALPADRGTYVVEKGDTLSSIARDTLGDESRWREIHELNKSELANPDILRVGMRLRLPERTAAAARPSEVARPPAPATPPPAAPAGTAAPATARAIYVVEQGDSLISIARNVLGDGTRWREIYELNKSQIANPDVLYVGLKLQLPERSPPAAPARRPR